MKIDGVILPTGADSRVNREDLCRLIDTRPEFRRPAPVQIINPFNRESVVVSPTQDVAEVEVDGAKVGNVSWSMSDDNPLINVKIEQSAVWLALEWARELRGDFREYPSPSEENA